MLVKQKLFSSVLGIALLPLSMIALSHKLACGDEQDVAALLESARKAFNEDRERAERDLARYEKEKERAKQIRAARNWLWAAQVVACASPTHLAKAN